MPVESRWAALEAHLGETLAAAASAAYSVLDANIARGERSGIQHPELPYRSSAPGEFPQEQFSALRNSLGIEPAGPLAIEVGSVNNPPPEAFDLEFRDERRGGRPWLSRTMEDPATWEEMNRGIGGGT
jgi:hypothetical protein